MRYRPLYTLDEEGEVRDYEDPTVGSYIYHNPRKRSDANATFEEGIDQKVDSSN